LNKFKKAVASVGVTAGLVMGGALIAAPGAQAVTYGSPY
jgi:hypothetical protein